MRIKTHVDNTLYLSSLWSDLSCAAELVIAGAPAGFLNIIALLYVISLYELQMTEEDSGPEARSAWCSSTSVDNTEFLFTWQISDYQRKKESVKRDDSIQSSTFTVQVGLTSSGSSLLNFTTFWFPVQREEVSLVPDLPSQRSCRGRGGDGY